MSAGIQSVPRIFNWVRGPDTFETTQIVTETEAKNLDFFKAVLCFFLNALGALLATTLNILVGLTGEIIMHFLKKA